MMKLFHIELSQAGSAGSGGGGGGTITAVNSGTNITVNTVGTVATVNLNDIVSLTHADDGSTQGQIQFNSLPFMHNYGEENTFVGQQSGNFTLTPASATENTGMGIGALSSLTTGERNVGVGASSAIAVTTGQYNTAVGGYSGTGIVTSDGNTAIGYQTLISGDSSNNTAVGFLAAATSTGGGNTAVGSACMSSVNGINNTAVGINALQTSTGNGNVAIGAAACQNGSAGGGNNVCVGSASGNSISLSSSGNVFLGTGAGSNMTGGSYNVYINDEGVSTESNAIRISSTSGTAQATTCYIGGIATVAVSNAEMVTIDTTTGQLGSQAIPSVSGITAVNSGTNITVNTVGTVATVNLNDIVNLTHADNGSTQGQIQFAGTRFLHNYGLANTFVGQQSGNLTLTPASATENTGMGRSTLSSLTTGARNVAVGTSSGFSLTTGSNNTLVGYGALSGSTAVNSNVAIGSGALSSLSTGSSNIALGFQAGNSLFSGSNNIYIGNAEGTLESNTIRIGTSGTHTSCYLKGVASVSVSNTNMVTIDTTTGQLGSTTLPVSPLLIPIKGVTTTPYTIIAGDYYLSVDTSSIAITIQLPNAPATGTAYVVKDRVGNAAANAISVTTVGGSVTIDGVTTYAMNTNYQFISLVFNGTSYEVW